MRESLHVAGVELVATKDIHGPRVMLVVPCAPVEAVTTINLQQAEMLRDWLDAFVVRAHEKGYA